MSSVNKPPRARRARKHNHQFSAGVPSLPISSPLSPLSSRPQQRGSILRYQTLKSSAGKDVPSPFRFLFPELLGLVIGFIRAAGHGTRSDSVVSRETKRDLSACSLTCRSWAEEFHPLVFERVTVRSDQDVRQLAAFLRSPGSKIAKYIIYLEVRASNAWTGIHTVPIALYNLLPCLHTLEFGCGPTASVPFIIHQLWPTRPNFPHLPNFDRTMLGYRCGLRGITSLTLRCYRFPDLGMLLRLVGGFSVLETLHCDGVSWCDDTPFTLTQLRMVPSLPSATLRTVTARSPPGMRLDYLEFLWLLACPESRRQKERRGVFHVEEIPTLIKLARFVYWGRGEYRRMTSFARSNMQYVHFSVDAYRRTFWL